MVARGTVGAAEGRLFAVRDYVDALLRAIRQA